jgi:hypothetical protein
VVPGLNGKIKVCVARVPKCLIAHAKARNTQGDVCSGAEHGVGGTGSRIGRRLSCAAADRGCGAATDRRIPACELPGRLGLTAARFKPKPLRHRGDRTPQATATTTATARATDYLVAGHPWPASHGHGAPTHVRALQSFNITWRYANRRAVTALANIVAKSRRRQAPRPRVASHNTSSCWRPAGAARRGHRGPKQCRSAARTSMCAFLRRPWPRCARTDCHRFGEFVAARPCACCARPQEPACALRAHASARTRAGRLNRCAVQAEPASASRCTDVPSNSNSQSVAAWSVRGVLAVAVVG